MGIASWIDPKNWSAGEKEAAAAVVMALAALVISIIRSDDRAIESNSSKDSIIDVE